MVVAGDFNKVGMEKMQATLKDLELKSIFNGLPKHEKGNELDAVFTNLKCVTH